MVYTIRCLKGYLRWSQVLPEHAVVDMPYRELVTVNQHVLFTVGFATSTK